MLTGSSNFAVRKKNQKQANVVSPGNYCHFLILNSLNQEFLLTSYSAGFQVWEPTKLSGGWWALVLAWPIACHLGLTALGWVSGLMYYYGYCIPLLENTGILPCLPHLHGLRTPVMQIWITVPANIWWPQNWVGSPALQSYDISFGSFTSVFVHEVLILGPTKSRIYLRQVP